MKWRVGFVSNSSSSSFVVPRSCLSTDQLERLLEKCGTPVGRWEDRWHITLDAETVRGFTIMDNGFDEDDGLKAWMEKSGFPMEAVVWEHDN